MESIKNNISVNKLEKYKSGDIDELIRATKDAIKAGMGFGWVVEPNEKKLKDFWKGILLVPNRILFVGRLNGSIVGSIQLVKPLSNNEAAAFRISIDTHFVATWARGYGIARSLIENAEEEAKQLGFTHVLLDVRETQKRAIKIYEQMNYIRWGSLPNYHKIKSNKMVLGHFYYKYLEESL